LFIGNIMKAGTARCWCGRCWMDDSFPMFLLCLFNRHTNCLHGFCCNYARLCSKKCSVFV